MKKIILSFIFISFFISVFSQGGWTWQQLPDLPIKTSNNAVTSASINDTTYVFSFFGIDSTKSYEGIHSKAFRYNTITQIWDTLPNIPDSLGGVIASGASTINGKIYIIGGYHVYSNGNEISSYETIIYDPILNLYTRGKNIPIEIDDHIQLTYKDSLIYIISGWTSSIGGGNNTNKVQVYDAINDEWYFANDMPNTSSYKVFGGSGSIVNDTIYFAGGARYSTNFPLVEKLRKGVINTSNPLNITWSLDTTYTGFKPYRAAAVNMENKVFWIGGSSVSYNYDGIAYNGSGGVNTNNFITEFNNTTNKWEQYSPTNFQVMDLRGIAKINSNEFIICGGFNLNQESVNSVFHLTYDTTFSSSTDSVIELNDTSSVFFGSNNDRLLISNSYYTFTVLNNGVEKIEALDMFGRTARVSESKSISMLGVQGFYVLQVTFRDGSLFRKKILVK